MSKSKGKLRILFKELRAKAHQEFKSDQPHITDSLSKNIAALLTDYNHDQPIICGGYCGMGSEFPFSLIKNFIDEICKRKNIDLVYAYPSLKDRENMAFISVDSEADISQTKMGFSQPIYDTSKIVIPDIMFVPAIAFDYAGNRLGHGMGHYDRYFDKINKQPLKVGVNYASVIDEVSLKLDSLPSEKHDVKMNCILTDSGLYKIKQLSCSA